MSFRATYRQRLNVNALSFGARSALCVIVLAGGTFACADVETPENSADLGEGSESALSAHRWWRRGAGGATNSESATGGATAAGGAAAAGVLGTAPTGGSTDSGTGGAPVAPTGGSTDVAPAPESTDTPVDSGASDSPPTPAPTSTSVDLEDSSSLSGGSSLRVLDPQNSGSTVAASTGAVCKDVSGATLGTACPLPVGATLTATPATGFGVKWGGACAGATGNSCKPSGSSGVTVSFDPTGPHVWWVSKTGKDSNDGHSIDKAFATFHTALRAMAGGDTLYIDDGVYNDSIGATGGNYSPWGTVQGKDGLSATQRTRIIGYRRHAVTVDGGGTLYPLSIYRGQHIEIANIVFLHSPLTGQTSYAPVHIEQSSDIYLHQIGAAYPDTKCGNCTAIGTETSSNVVVEESWAWGFGARYGVLFHGGRGNVARRNVVRYDGSIDGNPKAGVALYSEDESIAENNITLDFDAGPDSQNDVHAAFFATSSVPLTPPAFPPGLPSGLKTVSWFGNVAVNTVSTTQAVFYFDSLSSVGGTLTVVDNVAANGSNFAAKSNPYGFWLSGDDGTPHTSVVFSHNTAHNVLGTGVRIDEPPRWRAVTFNDNLISNPSTTSSPCVKDASGAGVRITASNNELFGCASQKVANDAAASTENPALRYFLRVEAGSPAKGTGTASSDRGATVVRRYVNGTLTNANLWPFPNEDLIKQDLCAGPDGTRLNGIAISTRGHNATGFCASGKTLTKYVWEQLGNSSPY
jgi:hypothetical protein